MFRTWRHCDRQSQPILIFQLITVIGIFIEIMFCSVFIDIHIRIIFDPTLFQFLLAAESPSVPHTGRGICFTGIVYVTDFCCHRTALRCHIQMTPDNISCKVIRVTDSCAPCWLLMVTLIIFQTIHIPVIKHTAWKLFRRDTWWVRCIESRISTVCQIFIIFIFWFHHNSIVFSCVIPLTHQSGHIESYRCDRNCISIDYLFYFFIIQYCTIYCRLISPTDAFFIPAVFYFISKKRQLRIAVGWIFKLPDIHGRSVNDRTFSNIRKVSKPKQRSHFSKFITSPYHERSICIYVPRILRYISSCENIRIFNISFCFTRLCHWINHDWINTFCVLHPFTIRHNFDNTALCADFYLKFHLKRLISCGIIHIRFHQSENPSWLLIFRIIQPKSSIFFASQLHSRMHQLKAQFLFCRLFSVQSNILF